MRVILRCILSVEELALLEDLVCDFPCDKWNGRDPATFSQWISPHGPRLKRVIFFTHSAVPPHAGVWERDNSSGSSDDE